MLLRLHQAAAVQFRQKERLLASGMEGRKLLPLPDSELEKMRKRRRKALSEGRYDDAKVQLEKDLKRIKEHGVEEIQAMKLLGAGGGEMKALPDGGERKLGKGLMGYRTTGFSPEEGVGLGDVRK